MEDLTVLVNDEPAPYRLDKKAGRITLRLSLSDACTLLTIR